MTKASILLTLFFKDNAEPSFRTAVISSAASSKFDRFIYDQRKTLECRASEFTDGLSCVQFLEPLESLSEHDFNNELKSLENQLKSLEDEVARSLGRSLIGVSRHWFVNRENMQSTGTAIMEKFSDVPSEFVLCGVTCHISQTSCESTSHSSCTSIVVTDPTTSSTEELEMLLQDSNSPLFLRDLLFHKINWIHGPRPQSQEHKAKHFVDEMIDTFVQTTKCFGNLEDGDIQLKVLWPSAIEIHARLLELRLAAGMLPLVQDQIISIQSIREPSQQIAFVTSNDKGLTELYHSLAKHHSEVSESVNKCTNLVTPLLETEQVFRSFASYRHEEIVQKASDAAAKHMRTLEGIVAAGSVGIGVAALLPEGILKKTIGFDSPFVDFDARLLLSLGAGVFTFFLIWLYHRRIALS